MFTMTPRSFGMALVKNPTCLHRGMHDRASNRDWHSSCSYRAKRRTRRRSIMSRKTVTRLACLAACATTVPIVAQAQQANEDLQAIDALTDMVANAMGRSATPIDRRIKLARCPEQASVTMVDAHTLAVRCAPLGWRLRVPLSAPEGGSADAVSATTSFSRPATCPPVIRRRANDRPNI